MRKAILGAASALILASPAVASDLAVTRYSEVPRYEREVRTREVRTREVQTFEHRTKPRVVVEERAPVVSETVVVRRPVIVERPRVVVEEYPVIEEYPIYPERRVYAYGGPVWREGWGHRRHFRAGW